MLRGAEAHGLHFDGEALTFVHAHPVIIDNIGTVATGQNPDPSTVEFIATDCAVSGVSLSPIFFSVSITVGKRSTQNVMASVSPVAVRKRRTCSPTRALGEIWNCAVTASPPNRLSARDPVLVAGRRRGLHRFYVDGFDAVVIEDDFARVFKIPAVQCLPQRWRQGYRREATRNRACAGARPKWEPTPPAAERQRMQILADRSRHNTLHHATAANDVNRPVAQEPLSES